MRGYRSPYGFTFRQALSINAPAAKGERGSPAILYKTRMVGDPADGADVGPADDTGDPRILRDLKTYSVFNAEQLTDCPQQYLNVVEPDPAARARRQAAVVSRWMDHRAVRGDQFARPPAGGLVYRSELGGLYSIPKLKDRVYIIRPRPLTTLA